MRSIVLTFALFLSSFFLLSQKKMSNSLMLSSEGIPSFEYMLESHQIWDIIQDSRGITYLAGGSLFQYNGKRVEIISNSIHIKAFAKNREGIIYGGGVGEFGFISTDSLGRTVFKSLKSKIDPSQIDKIEEVVAYDEKVYFSGPTYIYEYQEATEEVIVYKADTKTYPMFVFDNSVFATLEGRGIFKVSNGKLLNRDSIFNNPEIGATSVISFSDSLVLLGSDVGARVYKNGQITKMNLSWEQELKEDKFYTVIPITDQLYAFCFLENGVLITNEKFDPIVQWNDQNGFSDIVYKVYLGIENDLWIATNDGAFVLDLNSGITLMDERVGLKGLVTDMLEYEDKLVVSTFDGVYVKKWINSNIEDRFRRIENSGIYSYDLLPVGKGYFVNAYEGVGYIENEKYQSLAEKLSSNGFVIFSPDSTKIIATGNAGKELLVFHHLDGRWRLRNAIKTEEHARFFNASKKIFWDDAAQQYWISCKQGIASFQLEENLESLTSFKYYDEENGLPTKIGNAVVKLNNDIRFLSDSGLYQFNHANNLFTKDERFGNLFDKNGFYLLDQQNTNTYWYASRDGSKGIISRDSNSEPFSVESRTMSQLSSNSQVFRNITKGELIGGFKGIHQIGDPRKVNYKLTIKPLFTEVTTFNNQSDSTIYWGNQTELSNKPPQLNINSLRFKYAFPYSIASDKTRYSYKLEGFDENWSSWSTKTEKEYTNILPGNYKFLVKAKNVYGVESDHTAFSFSIIAPWYLSPIAYLLYIALLIAFIWLIVRLNAKRLERENEKLEKTILDRTEEIRYQAEKLQTLDNAKSRFFANVSHELRTPLTLIQGPLESVLNGSLGKVSDKIKSNLDLSQKSTKKLLNLVEEILDLSKLEAGKLELKLEAVNFSDLIKRIFFTYQSAADVRKVALNLSFQLEENTILKVDIGKLEKILDNLLSNALKFTPENGTINLMVSEQKGQLIISVQDNGIGIDKDELEHVFDRFYQAGKERKYTGGTGIGLALAKELALLMSGTLEVTSEAGEGTTFILAIPYIESEQEEIVLDTDINLIEAQKDHDTSFDPLDTKGAKVLVVEDDPMMRLFVKKELHMYAIDEAEDGLEALKKIEENEYDLIITDLMMPKLDGLDLVTNLRQDEKTKDISIMMLTARAGEDDVVHGLTLGVNDYLIKPFNPSELRARVNNILSNRLSILRELKTESPTSADGKLIEQLKAIVWNNLKSKELSVTMLANEIAISERQLNRNIKKITGLTAGNFIKEVRLNEARLMLENKSYNTISEICYAVGFEKPGYFTEIFLKRFGKRPGEYLG